MKKVYLQFLFMLVSLSAIAQSNVTLLGSGLMSEHSPVMTMIADAKNNVKAQVEIPKINEQSTFFLYNYDFKKNINYVRNCKTYYQLGLADSGKLIFALSLVDKKLYYSYFDQGGISMVCPRMDIPVKINMYGFHTVKFQVGELVPMVIVTDHKSKIPKELLDRILSKTRLTDIQLSDLEEVAKLTEYFSIIAYTIIKWKK